MNYEIKEEYKKMILAAGIVFLGIYFGSSILFNIAQEAPKISQEIKSNNKRKIIDFKQIEKEINVDINKTIDKKESKEIDLKKDYSKMENGLKYKNKKIYASIDNNGNPCYVLDSKFINKNGEFIPNNFIPEGMKCETIEIASIDNEKLIIINSLNILNKMNVKDLKNGYKFLLQGDGIKKVIEKCSDNLWMDNCGYPKKATIAISIKGPEEIPNNINQKALILTLTGDSIGVSVPSTRYENNNNFFLWNKIDFKSLYAINDLVDGVIFKTEKEMYKNKVETAIVPSSKKVYKKTIMGSGLCYIDENQNPVNENGKIIKIKNIPSNLDCKTLKEEDGVLILKNIKSILDFDDVEKNSDVKIPLNGELVQLKDCGKYWAETCNVEEKSKIYISKKDRSYLPNTSTKKAIFLTKEIEKGEHNIKNGVLYQDMYRWEKAPLQFSRNGYVDIPECKKNCYDDKNTGKLYSKVNNKIVKKVIKNGSVYFTSLNGKNILSPKTLNWLYDVDVNKMDGYTKSGIFFKNLNRDLDYYQAKKECEIIEMELPKIKDTIIEDKYGLKSTEMSWSLKLVDAENGILWNNDLIQKEDVNKKHHVICIKH